MDKPTFVYETYIDTTAEELWEALTSPDFTEQYWGGRRIQSDWEKGSTVKHVRPDGGFDWHGEVLQADPPKLLSYTFLVDDEDAEATKVTFELEPYGSVMRLRVTHEFESEVDPNIKGGWIAIISSLKSLLETNTALTYPWKG